jgi:hypothetical protein|nr:MAG TPA: hypothetical protein [Caudoviricetes sp.]
MSATFVLDFFETHVDDMFDEVYRLRNLPYETLKKSERRILKMVDRYIEFKRIQEPTSADCILCNADLDVIMSEVNI